MNIKQKNIFRQAAFYDYLAFIKQKHFTMEDFITQISIHKASDKRKLLAFIYEKYAKKMFLVCYRYVKNQADSEDILISGFIKIYDHLEQFENRGEGSLEAWIKKIIVNEALMHLRKKVNFLKEASEELNLLESVDSSDSETDTEDYLAMIRALPAGYRTVFNLYAIEGYSHKEIALKLNIQESTSRSQLTKAREMLKQLLTK